MALFWLSREWTLPPPPAAGRLGEEAVVLVEGASVGVDVRPRADLAAWRLECLEDWDIVFYGAVCFFSETNVYLTTLWRVNRWRRWDQSILLMIDLRNIFLINRFLVLGCFGAFFVLLLSRVCLQKSVGIRYPA